MAAGEIQLWPPTSTTLQRLERAADMEAVRAGLELVDELAFTREVLGPGLVRLTGGKAFGPVGRPANTILVGRERIVVVDPGDPDEAFIDLIEAEASALGGRIVAIALTHVDPGHAAGSLELHERTGAPIYAGPGGERRCAGRSRKSPTARSSRLGTRRSLSSGRPAIGPTTSRSGCRTRRS